MLHKTRFTAPLAALALTATFAAPGARALPQGPTLFCDTLPDAAGCQGEVVSCATCHAGPPLLNDFGNTVLTNLYNTGNYSGAQDYTANLPAALGGMGGDDSDGDGLTDMEEILLGTFPGDPESHWVEPAEPEGLDNPYFDVGNYDPKFAFKRVSVSYCGESPSYDDMQAFAAASDKQAAIHDKLDDCLDSDYWRDEALWRMADEKIRPLKAVGVDGDIILADYFWDYRLFSYALTDDRDARELLLADYHVDEDGSIVEGAIGRVPGSLLGTPIRVGSGQPLDTQRRAGMITTQWFLVVNTMFAQMPRTTAAQAYRAYLGTDIARGEGIHPVPGEPVDVDGKGVTNPTCAACHSTLDPLAYAFSPYNGIVIALFSNPSGQYDAGRAPWGGDGYLWGEPVDDLLDWANRAANSEGFAHNLAEMFYERALGHLPVPGDAQQFNPLWKDFANNGHSANAIIHGLVDTDAFGAP